MSSTRRAEKDSPLRQERFASSAEFQRGLLGNLVAKRCELLVREEDLQLIWWLQLRSWDNGGLEKFAADLVSRFPERVATKTMQEYGFKPGQVYHAKKVEIVRDELFGKIPKERHLGRHAQFRLRGELTPQEFLSAINGEIQDCSVDLESEIECDRRRAGPDNYPASAFLEACREMALCELPDSLASLCLDPSVSLDTFAPSYFPALTQTLREIMAAEIETRGANAVTTEIGKQVHETLDYCQQSRCMVLIDGLARTGKTHAAKSWCDARPGSARYIQVPSTNDDIGFFRDIASALGVSTNQNLKAQHLRERIEDVLQRGQLAVVFDEAHYLWPQGNFREKMPGRISWIMTALVNYRVPVALLTTPQFIRTQKTLERNSAWTSEQFTGRIGHYQKLPDSLSLADLSAVAKKLLPEGCAKSIETLATYAQTSVKYLAAIEHAVNRARFIAKKARREKVVFADVKNAIVGSAIPSDTGLAVALQEPKKQGRSRAISSPLQAPENPLETSLQDRRETRPASMDTAQEFPDANAPGTERNRGNLASV